MKKEGLLDKLILVGSWCVPLYEDYFEGRADLPPIRTRDIEFLIPVSPKLSRHTNLYVLLKDLGFVVDHKGRQGYVIYEHPDLILEFFVPSRGRGINGPYRIAELGISAQPLRFMDILAQNTIEARFKNIEVRIPHPANFGLQKLLIAKRRPDKSKAERDRIQAVAVLKALRASRDLERARALYRSLPGTWQKTIRAELAQLGETDMLSLLVAPQSGWHGEKAG